MLLKAGGCSQNGPQSRQKGIYNSTSNPKSFQEFCVLILLMAAFVTIIDILPSSNLTLCVACAFVFPTLAFHSVTPKAV